MTKKDFPLISIALCTYNGARYLPDQLDTLVQQTYPNLEIVAVDDNSSDDTWNILQEYTNRYSYFNIYRNPKNLGYQQNFEKALKSCSGEFLAISDQDDIWKADKIQQLYDNIDENIMIYHDSEFIDEKGQLLNMKMSDKLNMVEGSDPIPFLFFNCVSGHSLMFRKSLLEAILPFPNVGIYDHYIAFTASSIGKIKYLSKSLVLHRQHIGNSTDILGRKKSKSRMQVTLERMNRENNWLKTCAEVSKSKPASRLADMLYKSAKNRTNNLFNFRFGFLVWKYQNTLMLIPQNKDFRTLSFAIRQIWGAKMKSLVKR